MVGGGEGDGAEGRIERYPGDFEAFAAGAVLGGRHAEVGGGLFVETGGGRVAGVVHGGGDGRGLAELGLEIVEAALALELLGRDAEGGFEFALEVEGAVAGEAAHFVEGDGGIGVGFEVIGEDGERVAGGHI